MPLSRLRFAGGADDDAFDGADFPAGRYRDSFPMPPSAGKMLREGADSDSLLLSAMMSDVILISRHYASASARRAACRA